MYNLFSCICTINIYMFHIMKRYSGKLLIKARTKNGYKTRDSFYGNLSMYLEKQKRDDELPHYKTIQRMEKENKFSNKSIKLICEFLNIAEEDLIEENDKTTTN